MSEHGDGIQYPIHLGIDAIKKVIPHREPMLFARSVTVLDFNRYEGTALWERDSYLILGHFPEQGIVPGVVIIEAAAQIAAVGMRVGDARARDAAAGHVGVLMAVRRCTFRRPLFPGVEVRFQLQSRRISEQLVNTEGTASDHRGVVASLEFAFSQIPEGQLREAGRAE